MKAPMNIEDLLNTDEVELNQALTMACDLSWKAFGKKIRFYAPSFTYYKSSHFCSSPAAFPSISITGSSCSLKCKHCEGKVLNTMLSALTPKQLVEVCSEVKGKGGIGCLISGGCLPDGSVPLGKFVNAIAEVKQKLGLTVVVHTGVVDLSMSKRLKEAGVDAALIDIIGSDETIKEIYQLKVRVSDYEKSLDALQQSGVAFVPHVLVGLHYGQLKGEFQALKMIAKYSPSAVIIIVLMPIRGTVMQKVTPPSPKDITRVLVAARFSLPKTPLVLGCMRPKGKHRAETDRLAVEAGVNAIAFPDAHAIQAAESLGLETVFSSLCCSQVFEDLKRSIWKT